MPTLLSSDWHLTDRPLDQYRLRCLSGQLPKLIRKHRVDWLVVLGDLTENHDAHRAGLVNQVVDLLTLLSQLCPVTIVQGNHDYYRDPTNAFFRFIDRMPNLNWIGETADLGDWTLIPHLRSNDELRLIASSSGNGKVWLTHATFAGAVDGGYALRGLDPALIPGGVEVYSGDVHVPQTIGPVTYVGAPYHLKFGDRFAGRMILLDGQRETSILIDGPKKLALESRIGEAFGGAARPGDIVSIRVHLEARHVADWQGIRQDYLALAHADGLVVASIAMVPPSNRDPGSSSGSRARRKPDAVLVREFAQRRQLDKDTLQAGLNLLKDEG